MLRYGIGQFYKVHSDTLRDEVAGPRVSALDEWTCRALRMLRPSKCMQLLLVAACCRALMDMHMSTAPSEHMVQVATILIYLNEPEEGGETAFPVSGQ